MKIVSLGAYAIFGSALWRLFLKGKVRHLWASVFRSDGEMDSYPFLLLRFIAKNVG